jgi:ketosteroid isomerase-like protein
MKGKILLGAVLFIAAVAAISGHGQSSEKDEAGRIQALELAWNHALEAKDASALDMLLADTMISVDIDGSVQTKSEFLASIKAPDYQPSQATTEQSKVQMYGDAAVVIGIFRIKGVEKGKAFVHRERFVDTWIKNNGAWQCVATTAAPMSAKQPTD